MAKVRGPLMSFGAKGSVGRKSLTFSMTNSQTIAKSFGFDKRKPSPAQKNYHQHMKTANKIWKELPQYLKDEWTLTPQNTKHYSDINPFQAQVKGRLLFLSRALSALNAGFLPYASPYGPEPAPRIYEISPTVFEMI